MYQSTPDYYRDYIEHGWLRDQAAKAHKYIKRWRNKAGKWVYQYANDRRGNKIKKLRDKWGATPDVVTYDIRSDNRKIKKAMRKGQGYIFGYRGESGRPSSMSDLGRAGSRRISTTHIDLNNTRPKKKARITSAFNARQAQLAENRRRTAANVAHKREMDRMQADFDRMQSDFDKEYARVKKKMGR